MRGLIIKEFINLKKNFWIIGALVVFYGFIAFMTDDPSGFSGIFTLIIALFLLNTYSIDEMAKWDSYALTMPLTRDNIIQGKYIMMLILALIGFMVNGSMLLALNLITNSESLFGGIGISIGGAVVVIIFYSIMIPIISKVGILKARIYFIIIYMLPFMLGLFIFKRIKDNTFTIPEWVTRYFEVIEGNIYIITSLLLIVIMGISYSISLGFYRKKEF